jgi:hypothetical protein
MSDEDTIYFDQGTDDLKAAPWDFEADPDLEEFAFDKNERVAIIRTSDRGGFKRCRRRWNWQSHLRGNLTTIEQASPLWFGTGIHYALEDFHGNKDWPTAREAFDQYVKATYQQTKVTPRNILPADWADLTILGRGMLDYYENHWLVARDPLKTFIFKGKPQVEVHALIEVPIKVPNYDRVLYAVTLDRVVVYNGGLWILDYKTAKRIQTHFFQTDPQISSYCWVGSQLYGQPISGFIYQQHRKDLPDEPRIVNGLPSTSKRQKLTHRYYRQALKKQFGDVSKAPISCIDHLNWLETQETDSRDFFIRRDFIERNQHQIEAEGEKILMEVEDMLNPNIPLYPNPTRDCGHLCSFNIPCISMDDGGDWEFDIKHNYREKDAVFDGWRSFLPEGYQ